MKPTHLKLALPIIILGILPTLSFANNQNTNNNAPVQNTEIAPTKPVENLNPPPPPKPMPATPVAGTTLTPFQKTCVDTWVEKNKGSADFRQFGEKYCGCAETQQPLDSDAAINKAIQVCMSRTLLQDAVDKLKATGPLSKISSDDLTKDCMNSWQLIYPSMNAQDKQAATNYCQCANPKLLELFKNSSSMSDTNLSTAVHGVAAACSGHVGKE